MDYDFATVKYNPSGDELWVSRYDATNNDYAYGLAVDADGSVYVTGSSLGDFATVKYDAAGNELWVRLYDAGAGDQGSAISLDGAGGVYVTGTSYGTGTTLYDYATVAYDPAGNQRWVQRYNGPGNNYDQPHAVAVDELGNVYVTGQSGGSGTASDLATIKYAPTGTSGVAPLSSDSPATMSLVNDPNPFRSTTTLEFAVPGSASGSAQSVRLALYDVQGRQAALVVDQVMTPGRYRVDVDARGLAGGIYYCRLDAGRFSETRKMIRVE
jgi:hypothetical protein